MSSKEYLDIPDFLRNQEHLKAEQKVKAKPILFNSEMVNALLDGRKTQTRRIMKPQPEFGGAVARSMFTQCPHGQPGDLLYVRETFASHQVGSCITYKANKHPLNIKPDSVPWTPSIHMPRWASRITLKITDVRVERVQDISEDDAKQEGFKAHKKEIGGMMLPISPLHWYRDLWNSINNNWNENPYVWVIVFSVIHKNVDEIIKGDL